MTPDEEYVCGKSDLRDQLEKLLMAGEGAGISREDIVDDFCEEIYEVTTITVIRE